MKKEFQKGDRVKVFATIRGVEAETKGCISGFSQNGLLFVEFDEVSEITGAHRCIAHPKQCRRLIKKERRLIKKERRRVWIAQEELCKLNETAFGIYDYPPTRLGEGRPFVEFVEARTKK